MFMLYLRVLELKMEGCLSCMDSGPELAQVASIRWTSFAWDQLLPDFMRTYTLIWPNGLDIYVTVHLTAYLTPEKTFKTQTSQGYDMICLEKA